MAGEDTPLPPLKRHEALQPLSREHMSGLVQARNLTRACVRGPSERAAAVAGFVHAWRTEIREHFDDEERLLLPACTRVDLRERLLSEHRALRDLAERCESAPGAVAGDPALMRGLGALLHDHIRWEERVFFEALQTENPAALAALLHVADEIHDRRPGSRPRRSLGGPPPDSMKSPPV